MQQMASGVPVVSLIFYARFCSIRSALSLSCFAPVLAAFCLVHLGVQWGLPVLFGAPAVVASNLGRGLGVGVANPYVGCHSCSM